MSIYDPEQAALDASQESLEAWLMDRPAQEATVPLEEIPNWEDLEATGDEFVSDEEALMDEENIPQLWCSLTNQHKQYLTDSFGLDGGDPRTMAEVAKMHGVSKSMAHITIMHAISRLQQAAGHLRSRYPE